MLVKIIEFLPVIIFFVSYKMTSNLILATTLIVGSCVVATIAEAIITKKLSRMQVFLVFAVLIFWCTYDPVKRSFYHQMESYCRKYDLSLSNFLFSVYP